MIHWFFIVYWSILALVVILFWITEFSIMRFSGKKKKSEWKRSKERVSHIYKNYDYESYRNRPYSLKK